MTYSWKATVKLWLMHSPLFYPFFKIFPSAGFEALNAPGHWKECEVETAKSVWDSWTILSMCYFRNILGKCSNPRVQSQTFSFCHVPQHLSGVLERLKFGHLSELAQQAQFLSGLDKPRRWRAFESQVLLAQTSESNSRDSGNLIPATSLAGEKLPLLRLPLQVESLLTMYL